MKMRTIMLVAMAALYGAANAQVSGLEIGYCEGNVNTTSKDGFSSMADDEYISAAIRLTPEMLSMYEGCSIDQIHAGMASVLNIDELQVWLRSDLEGENFAEGTITKSTEPKLAKGWNIVPLEEGWTIPADSEAIYVGLTFHQTSVSVGLSVVSPQTIAPQEGGLYVKLGKEEEWQDRSAEGTAALEAMVFGEQLPKYNLTLRSLDVMHTYVVDKPQLEMVFSVRNSASHTISGFDAVCTIDGSEEEYTIHFDETLAYKDEKEFTAVISPEASIKSADPAERILTLTIKNLTEGEEQFPEDNVLSDSFEVVEHDFVRQVLVEEFTTELCTNCPRVAAQMHDMLAMEGYDERVNVICHHSAYYTDWLTIPADNEYMWLFNMNGSTYAPAVVIDRMTGPDFSTDKEYSPIFMPSSTDHLAKTIAKRFKEVAYVSLKIETELVNGKALVKVTGERIKEDFTVNPARIVVALVEDNINARSQAGSGGSFVHQHVNRAYNSTWGEVIEWDGNEYTYECELPTKESYKKEDLSIVAYIWDYDPSDVTACSISNSAKLRYAGFEDNTSGIDAIATAEAIPTAWYNMNGMRTAGPVKGINIVRYSDGSTKKVMVAE